MPDSRSNREGAQAVEFPNQVAGARLPVRVRRLLKVSAGVIPYLAWLAPFLDRFFMPKHDTVSPALLDMRKDLNYHFAALQASRVDISPAIEEQHLRLQKLEEQAIEINHSIENLSQDQLDLADQVRSVATWVRNAALAGLFLLTLMLILKTIQMFHGAH